MWRWLRSLTSGHQPPSLRSVPVIGAPYREAPHAADPATLTAVMEALRDAGLGIRAHRRGFELSGAVRDRVMAVRVRDPRRVLPEDLSCGADAPELLLDLALALVPLFGPLLADVRFAGTILVDGTRDRRALGEEAAEHIQRVRRRIAMRVPATLPILSDLVLRMRQQR